MVKHIIIWNFKESLSEEEKRSSAERIKKELEALSGRIDGLVSIRVEINMLPTSNGDMMLDSEFTNEYALSGYAVHPDHLAVKDFIGSVTCGRKCVDYMI